jgi:hypothetical protein
LNWQVDRLEFAVSGGRVAPVGSPLKLVGWHFWVTPFLMGWHLLAGCRWVLRVCSGLGSGAVWLCCSGMLGPPFVVVRAWLPTGAPLLNQLLSMCHRSGPLRPPSHRRRDAAVESSKRASSAGGCWLVLTPVEPVAGICGFPARARPPSLGSGC